ncbi:hypothetical protein RF11_11480 [Thelohanellus kitauei]|uniref:Uncharacterized protein n=1 Tax=Thelohanellus kitauei TaxID=669202 RepID=A0A0C2JQN0_THEKT|nr:hypothetical protein RF11_11480 [Thelohanellus kitauei]
MGIKITIENFEILNGYSDISGKRVCIDEDRENFTKCPISVYVKLGYKDPIRLLDMHSNIIEKKIEYSQIITSVDIKENKQMKLTSIYSIYFASYIITDQGGDINTFYIFDILTSDKNIGIFSQECNGCISMMGIVRYWGFLK